MGDLNIEQKSGQELMLNFLAQERTVSGRKGDEVGRRQPQLKINIWRVVRVSIYENTA